MRNGILMLVLLLLCGLLAACASDAAPQATRQPTMPVLIGQVTIDAPLTGSSIYAETLSIRGSANDLPPEGFMLRVVTASDDVLAATRIQPDGANWGLDLVHGYTGDPTEVSIIAEPANPLVGGDYALNSVLLLPLTLRPEGVFGAIAMPAPDTVVGGDQIQVQGTLSGVPEMAFNLGLYTRAGDRLSEQRVQLPAHAPIDEAVWQTSLDTAGYTGPAIIRMRLPDAAADDVLNDVFIMISIAAG